MMNAMLLSSNLPQNLWEEAILFINYILNKLPKKKTKKRHHMNYGKVKHLLNNS